MQQRRFTKEFEEEAVRLVQTSGRTQREIAGDLGIGLSTLVRWIGRSRDQRATDRATAVASDVTAELKRLRRENSSESCETTTEERGAGNPHATFCGNRWTGVTRPLPRPCDGAVTAPSGRRSCESAESTAPKTGNHALGPAGPQYLAKRLDIGCKSRFTPLTRCPSIPVTQLAR